MYENCNLTVLRTSTRIESGPHVFDESRLSMTFLTNLRVTGTLYSFEVQWNLSKLDTYGTEVFVQFREVSALERFELESSQI